MSYTTPNGAQHYDYNWSFSRDGDVHYRKSIPSSFDVTKRRRKVSQDRSDLRGKVCPSCGLTRSMTNLCDCNS